MGNRRFIVLDIQADYPLENIKPHIFYRITLEISKENRRYFYIFILNAPLYNFSIKNVIQGFLMYNKFANKKIRKKVILYDKLIIQRKNYNW